MDPVEALHRAAYLLDRSLAPPAKAKAFLRAADTVAALDPDQLRGLAAAGKLTDLPGVGASTGGVIADALADRPSPYLAKLEASTAIPLGEGEALRGAIQGDCHSHSTWSDGGTSVEQMARAAMALGHRYLVMTDHSPRMSVARGLTADRLGEQLDEIAALNERFAAEAVTAAGAGAGVGAGSSGAGFRVLTGMEVDINEDGSLDMDDATLARLDLVIASPHVKLRMDRKLMTRRLAIAAMHPHVDVLGHCTGRKVPPHGARPGADFDADLVFAACAQHGTAVEINCRPERQDPPEELLALALEWDCELAIDTDAHAPGQLEWLNYGCDKAARLGVEPERVVNTWDADRLLARGRRAG